MTTKVVVVDDQELVRAGFVALLASSPDLDIVGEAGQGEEAVRLVAEQLPDVVLMDVGCLFWTGSRRPSASWPIRAVRTCG